MRAVVVGHADLTVGQKLGAGKTVVEYCSIGSEEVASVASGADGGRGTENAIGNILRAARGDCVGALVAFVRLQVVSTRAG